MERSYELTDSTDWIDTPLNLLAPLESSLRCQICKDFFTSPVITSCCHTFCSLCIRRCLSSDQKCPVCRQTDQELKLRRNWAVEELLENFKKARPSVLDLARKEAARIKNGTDQVLEPSLKKRKVDQVDRVAEVQAAPSPQRVRTRSRAVEVNYNTSHVSGDLGGVGGPNSVQYIKDSEDDEDEYIPDDCEECPICFRSIRLEEIERHVNACLDLPKPSPAKRSSAFGPLQQRPQGPQNKLLERLPAINYGLFKETALRKKLRDLGISDAGPKALLQRRHTEWMNLWNSNCDSKNPKTKAQLGRELDTWERTQGGHAAPPAPERNAVTSKDFNAAEWSASHNDDFKLLIANARKKSDAQVRSTIPRASASNDAGADAPSASMPANVGASTVDPDKSLNPSG